MRWRVISSVDVESSEWQITARDCKYYNIKCGTTLMLSQPFECVKSN